jgi:hypothetical protein
VSNPDKHKPLSPEELFKLLDNTSDEANNFDELDDFEKEALEGFSAHSNSEKAKTLTDELNVEISKKAANSQKGSSKNKIVWFSAAASIVLIVMISVFFFTQSKKDSANNIALNEIKEEKMFEAPQNEVTPQLETISKNAGSTYSTGKAEDRGKELAKILQPDIPKKQDGNVAVLTYEPTIGSSETKPALSPITLGSKDEAKNRRENDDNDEQKVAEVLVDKMDAKKKEKNGLSQEHENSEVAANQNVNTAYAKTSKEEAEYYKADGDRTVVANQSLEKEKATSTTSTNSVNKAKKNVDAYDQASAAPVSGSSTTVKTNDAYYIGGELAIKDYVVLYFKEKKISNQAVGKFKVSGIVDDTGIFKVVDIVQITKNNCNCIDDIKQALNSMNKWVAGTKGGKNVSVPIEFTIAF